MKLKLTVPFKIVSIDSLGQGVSKEGGNIVFIPKTLPGEEGEALIHTQKKGVAFGELKKLSSPSEKRIEAVCPHFAQCPSCHFLHTDYQQELLFKKEALEKIFFKLPLPNLKVIGSSQRLGYRNRIQLHYDTKARLLGYLHPQNFNILPVPHCLMGVGPVAEKMRSFYQDNQWLLEVPKGSAKGHVEIYQTEQGLKTSWNRPYAEGGFSQVFEEMNLRLKSELKSWFENFESSSLLDLFGGNGNLSSGLTYTERLCVDIYQNVPGPDFTNQHLYADDALSNVKKTLNKRSLTPKTLILDPPRSGFKELGQWLEELKPERVAYVSCDAHTMVRDLLAVKNYQIKNAFLVDFFPSTYHFETMIFLERKD